MASPLSGRVTTRAPAADPGTGGKNRELETLYAEQTAVRKSCAQQIDETALKEQELRKSEERFRNLIDASPVPIVLVREGRFMYANMAFCRMSGYDRPAEVIGRDLLEFVAPESREKVAGYIRARSRENRLMPIMTPSAYGRMAAGFPTR